MEQNKHQGIAVFSLLFSIWTFSIAAIQINFALLSDKIKIMYWSIFNLPFL